MMNVVITSIDHHHITCIYNWCVKLEQELVELLLLETSANETIDKTHLPAADSISTEGRMATGGTIK